MSETQCVIEVPPRFCDQLNATLTVALLEEPSYAPTNIITVNQDYIVRVCVELGADIKKLLCGEWVLSVAIEGIGPAKEFKKTQIIPMDNCNPKPDCWDFRIKGSEFGVSSGGDAAGDVFYIVITVVARDSCAHKPIGIAGFCKVGPVMVF